MTFDDLELIDPILEALREEGYTEPTPIQQQAIPVLFEGRDVLGIAQTGTGKTAAFSLPIIQLLSESKRTGRRAIRCLVVSPTRELAAQIQERFDAYGRNLDLRSAVIFGGVSQGPQVDKLRRGIDILVATPGRLLDLQEQGHVDLSQVEFLILDEADRMLDMGFIRDIRKLVALVPDKRQTLLFSATMPRSIADLAGSLLTRPVRVEVVPESTPVERINQKVMLVPRHDKRDLLAHLIQTRDMPCVIVFTRTKHGANRVAKHLEERKISAAAIHGNKSQGARTRALDGFRGGTLQVLVATDVASRGIDVDGITHVVNFDLPHPAEVYVHRIGRTARAGASGASYSFCDETESSYLDAIQQLIKLKIDVDDDHEWHDAGVLRSNEAAPHITQGRQQQERARERAASRGRGRGGPPGGRRGGGGGGGGGRRSGGGGGRRR